MGRHKSEQQAMKWLAEKRSERPPLSHNGCEHGVEQCTSHGLQSCTTLQYPQHQANQLAELYPPTHPLVQPHTKDDHSCLPIVLRLDGTGDLRRESLAKNLKLWYGSAQYRCRSEMVHRKEIRPGIVIFSVKGSHRVQRGIGCCQVKGHMYPVCQSPLLCDRDENLVCKRHQSRCCFCAIDCRRSCFGLCRERCWCHIVIGSRCYSRHDVEGRAQALDWYSWFASGGYVQLRRYV
jgi:hypothetical protein